MTTVLLSASLTLSDLYTRIAREIHHNNLTTDIQTSVNRAIKFYQARRMAFNPVRSSLTLTAGTEYYSTATAAPSTLPSDIGQIDRIVITVGTRLAPLYERTPAEMDVLASDTNTRQEPSLYSFYGGELRLYPVPDQAYVLTINYLRKEDADATSSVWTNEAEDLICHAAKKRIYRDVLLDAEAASLCAQAEVDEYRRLLRDACQLSTGGLVGSW